jgi:hypothetical protein
MASLASKAAPYDRARFYTIDGHKLPSVTTILDVLEKPGLMWWAANMERRAMETALLEVLTSPGAKDPEWVLGEMAKKLTGAKAFLREQDKAKTIGTATHAWIEWRTRQMLGEKVTAEPVIPDAAMVAVEAWKDWATEVNFTPICAERTIYCVNCGYAGTLDWIAKVRGMITLGDYKTAKAIYPESYLQNVAYRHAAAKCGLETAQGLVLRLPKTLDDPAFEAAPVPQIPLEDFLAVKQAWEWKRRMEGKWIGGREAPARPTSAP